MLRGMTVAAAIVLAGPAMAPAMADETCLTDSLGAQCDIFLEQYRNDEVPVGTANVRPTGEFLLEEHQDFGSESSVERPTGEDVLYWDGDSAMIVSEDSGPRVEIADW
jgi:hypothetical protein